MSTVLKRIGNGFCVATVLAVVVAAFLLTGVIPVWQSIRSSDWQIVPCTILESGSAVVHTRRSSRAKAIPDYRIEISYRYEFAGREYRSGRFSFFREHASATTTHSLALQFPPGTTTTCFVNPRKPDEAVLDRGIRFGQLLFPVSFVVGGALMVFIWWLNRRARETIGG